MQLISNVNLIILLLTLAFNLALGVYIYLKDSRNESNLSFAGLLLLIFFWTTSFVCFSLVSSPTWVLFWRRVTPIGSSLLAGYLVFFSSVFPKREASFYWWKAAIIFLPGLLFSALSLLTPLLIKSFTFIDTNYAYLGTAQYGPLYKLYAIYILSFFLWAFIRLAYRFVKSEGREKLQVFYVLVGVLLSVTIGVLLSLILPIFGFSDLFMFGPTFTIVLALFITYAIIRHKLLFIEDFFTRGLILASSIIAFSLTVYFVLINEYKAIFPAFVIIADFTIGAFVFFKNVKGKVNISFFGITILLSIWALAVFSSVESSTAQIVLSWSKITSIVTALFPPFFVFFCYVFPKGNKKFTKFEILALALPAICFSILGYLNLIVVEAIGSPGKYTFIYGSAFPFLSIYFGLYMIYGFYVLVKKYFITTGISKNQIRYFFFGALWVVVPGSITNFILPLMGHSEFRWMSPAFSILAFFIISYAIVKYRLMSIDVVIKRGVAYGLVTIIIMAIYALAVIISQIFLQKIIGYSSLLVTAGAALMIAVIYQPMIKYFQNSIDRLFYKERYDYQKSLREVTYRIASIIKLEQLAKIVISSFLDTMKVSEVSLLLLQGNHYRSFPLTHERYQNMEMDRQSPIAICLKERRDMLIREEVEAEINIYQHYHDNNSEHEKVLLQAKHEMDTLNIPLWIPIISKEELIGIIALGEKRSGDIFTSEDLQLMAILANQVAMALDNTKLYQEVLSVKNYAENILQSMTSGLITTDATGKIITFNNMAERITGLSADSVFGKTVEEIWGNSNPLVEMINHTLQDRCYTNNEIFINTLDRNYVPLSVSTTLVRDGMGRRQGALLTFNDLTEVKELEGKVRRADKLAALGTMAAGMAHEIKNPLSSMKVLTQLMPLKYDNEEFRGKFQEIMPREISRIDRIVENLLGFARATTPKFEMVDVRKVIEENLEYFSENIQNNKIKIIKNFNSIPEITADAEQLSQVFSNLILNAVQAMKDGGQIEITVREGGEKKGFIDTIIVEVQDNGPGISEDHMRKLFDPFFTTKHEGTGLGLTITHSIINAHKGAIDCTSQVGQGTRFIVTLPVTQ